MIDLILLLLFNACAIIGIHLAFGEDMIFERLGHWIESKIPYDLTKPLFNCPTCMASVHSILPYWLTHDFNTESLLWYLIYVPALAYVATRLGQLIDGE